MLKEARQKLVGLESVAASGSSTPTSKRPPPPDGAVDKATHDAYVRRSAALEQELAAAQSALETLRSSSGDAAGAMGELQDSLGEEKKRVRNLEAEIAELKDTNAALSSDSGAATQLLNDEKAKLLWVNP